ncbi:MAG: hypothetical protein IJN03_02975 [Bacilli bacterium]|nr:hypothetical protein [Bacilli bacterium]
MNQILNFKEDEESAINDVININYNKKSKYAMNKFLKFQFIFSNIITIIFIFYFVAYKINVNRQEKLSQELINGFNISSLYNSSSNYISEKAYYNYDANLSFNIIGIIEIPKINITYPIISQVNDEFLKIAPCKFYGPELSKVR